MAIGMCRLQCSHTENIANLQGSQAGNPCLSENRTDGSDSCESCVHRGVSSLSARVPQLVTHVTRHEDVNLDV